MNLFKVFKILNGQVGYHVPTTRGRRNCHQLMIYFECHVFWEINETKASNDVVDPKQQAWAAPTGCHSEWVAEYPEARVQGTLILTGQANGAPALQLTFSLTRRAPKILGSNLLALSVSQKWSSYLHRTELQENNPNV